MMLPEALAMAAVGMVFGITVGSIVGHFITEAIMGTVKPKKKKEVGRDTIHWD